MSEMKPMIEVCELIAASFVMLPACLVGMTREGVEESGTLLLMWWWIMKPNSFSIAWHLAEII
jgi:hypothetical protein